MIKCDSDLSLEIIKLSKKFASLHSKHMDLYGSFEDFVSELTYIVIKNLKSYDKSKGNFSTWCYKVFSTKIIRDIVKNIKKENIYEIKSLDDCIDDDGNSLIEIIPESFNYKEDLENKINSKNIVYKLLPYMSKDFIRYALEEKLIVELSREKNISKQNMFNKIKRERLRLRKALENNNFDKLKRREPNYEFESEEIYY